MRRWILGITTGAITAAVVYFFLLPKPDPVIELVRASGRDPHTFGRVREIQKQAAATKSITAAQMGELSVFANDKDSIVRIRALSTLIYLGDTDFRTEALALARKKLSDPSPVVRMYALVAMDRLGASDAQTLAVAMLKDPDKVVRTQAAKIVKRGQQ